MNSEVSSNNDDQAPEDYDTPNIVGDIDTVEEEIEFLEKKKKIPVWIWLLLIIVVAFVAYYITSQQSPTLVIPQ